MPAGRERRNKVLVCLDLAAGSHKRFIGRTVTQSGPGSPLPPIRSSLDWNLPCRLG